MGGVRASPLTPAATRSPKLAVSEIFGPTFQGEGPTAGRRAAFVRLGRCNLDCAWCDTPFTWDWTRFDPAAELEQLAPEEVARRVAALGVDRVVVTGGEPLLQQRRLLPLLSGWKDAGVAVEIETNGTRAPLPEVAACVAQFNVSIKLASSGVDERRRLRPAVIAALAGLEQAVFKFVACSREDLDEVQALADAHALPNVWIMPEGTSAETIVRRTRELADEVIARGWHMGTRLHVLAWGNERGR